MRAVGVLAGVAISAALQMGSDHIMFVDADDFVADDLAEFVNANRDAPGWFMNRGYLLTPRAFTPYDSFHMRCGTSNILRADLLAGLVPHGLDAHWPPSLIADALDRYVMLELFGNHKHHARYFGSMGHQI